MANIEHPKMQVSCGYYHCTALRSDGSLVSWGRDSNNQVSNTPNGNDFIQVSCGYQHCTALRSDGSLVSWGTNNSGQVSNTPKGNDFINRKYKYEYINHYKGETHEIDINDSSILYMVDPSQKIAHLLPSPTFLSSNINNYSLIEFTNDRVIPIQNVPYSRINKNESIHNYINNYSNGLHGKSMDIIMGGFDNTKAYTLSLKFGVNKPPTIKMKSQFITHDNEVNITINVFDPDGDMYKMDWDLKRSDGIEVFSRSTGLSSIHLPIVEKLTPRVNIPIEENKPMDFILTVNAEDQFGNKSAPQTATITIINNNPVMVVENNPKYIKVTVSDPDMDGINGTIIANPGTNNEVFLTNIHSDKGEESKDIIYYYTPGDLLVNKTNTIKIDISDSYFGKATKTIEVIGSHRSLMFYDDTNNLYTDDIGNILQYMTFDKLTAGQSSDPQRVRVINKTSRPLRDVMIKPDNRTISTESGTVIYEQMPENIWVELALPRKDGEVNFNWQRELDFSDIILYDDEYIDLFVRVVTDPGNGLLGKVTRVTATGVIIETPSELDNLERELGYK